MSYREKMTGKRGAPSQGTKARKQLIAFKVSKDTLDVLEARQLDGESISQCARRLLLEALAADTPQ